MKLEFVYLAMKTEHKISQNIEMLKNIMANYEIESTVFKN